MDLNGIWKLFGFGDEKNDKKVSKELENFKKSPQFKLKMFAKMISQGVIFKKQLIDFFKNSDPEIEMDGIGGVRFRDPVVIIQKHDELAGHRSEPSVCCFGPTQRRAGGHKRLTLPKLKRRQSVPACIDDESLNVCVALCRKRCERLDEFSSSDGADDN